MLKISQYYLFLMLFILNLGRVHGQAKLISIPQQGPDTRLLKNHLAVWEKQLPFVGLSINFNDNKTNNKTSIGYYGRGNNELCFSVFDRKKTINYNDYTNAIADLRRCNFLKFKNNFMILSIFNNNWSLWDDNASWDHLLANLGSAAKIAHDAGLKGIILDTETYGSPQNLDLVFYCQQFANKIYTKGTKTAYIRIKTRKDLNTLDDLFPKPRDIIYWKDINDLAKMSKVYLNIYKDNNGDFYYPLIDPKYKKDIASIVNDVEKRGSEIVSVINKNFPSAEIMLTVGPSYVKSVLSNIYGLNSSNNYLWTVSGLIIPFTKGMLANARLTNIKIIDGQEQSYYFKTQKQFENLQKDFNEASKYYTGDAKSKYLLNMNQAIGLYVRTTSTNNKNPRLFDHQDIINAFKYAISLSKVKYIWIYEENESCWFIESLRSRYMSKNNEMSKFGGDNFNEYIQNIDDGIKKLNHP
jgi:hypothetical protein